MFMYIQPNNKLITREPDFLILKIMFLPCIFGIKKNKPFYMYIPVLNQDFEAKIENQSIREL